MGVVPESVPPRPAAGFLEGELKRLPFTLTWFQRVLPLSCSGAYGLGRWLYEGQNVSPLAFNEDKFPKIHRVECLSCINTRVK